jgi:hypothetical protein
MMTGVSVILVHLPKTWPSVVSGKKTAAEVTLNAWAAITDADLNTYADAILGIVHNEVVSAFDVTSWERGEEDDRIRFRGEPSMAWSHLIGTPNPGKPWVRGMARPVQYLSTIALTKGTVSVEESRGGRRAVIDDFTLTVSADGLATILVPAGRSITVTTLNTQPPAHGLVIRSAQDRDGRR